MNKSLLLLGRSHSRGIKLVLLVIYKTVPTQFYFKMNGNRKSRMDQNQMYLIQSLFSFVFLVGIAVGSRSFDFENKDKWATSVARYVAYILTIQAIQFLSVYIFDFVNNERSMDLELFTNVKKNQALIFLLALAMIYLNDQKLYAEDFPLICLAKLIISYISTTEKETKTVTITYGSGMACSYVEGYLVHVIPSDGRDFEGFLGNIKYFESKQGVVFPVKKLFIIITKTMYCPPDLNEFNDKSDRDDVSRLEACQSFKEVVKDVAGVKGRYYRNSAYKITRPHKRPVYVAAECATSIHTLYKVLKNKDLYDELADIDPPVVVTEFIDTLNWILQRSPDLKNKCDVLYFDDTNPDLNLADFLLDRIQELEPRFEEFVGKRK